VRALSPIAALVVLLAVACSKDAPDPNAAVCGHYAELMVKCAEGDSNPAVLDDTSRNFCQKGMSGKHDDIFGPKYRRMIECTRTAETCDALHACQDAP
jgi:hypothetical protein